MLLVLVALLLGASVFLVAEAVTYPARRRSELAKRAATYGSAGAPSEAAVPGRARRGGSGLAPVWAVLGRPMLKLMPKTTREDVARRLLSAGLTQKITPDELLAAKTIFTAIGVLLGLVAGAKANPAAAVLLAPCFGLLGFLAPDVYVNGKIRERRERIQASLPNALDLLAVSVEAGLGFDGAVAKLVEYMDGPLIEEFALALTEMRIGESRMEALKRMASRVDVPELGSFVRAVVQADQLGTSMANLLRTQAVDTRTRRQFAAEERAMQAPIKMLFPTAIFIFPAMFIVILGPAVMDLLKSFSSG
jgi:tight adherence protein C